MRYAYVIVGIIVLVLIFGLVFAFTRPGARGMALNGNGAYNNNYAPYQASVAGTVANGCPTSPCQTTAAYQLSAYPVYTAVPVATNAYTAGYSACPTAYGANAAATWYTSPAYTTSYMPGQYSYYYPTTRTNTTVYPGSSYYVPGSTQTYQYNVPGYSGGYYGGGYQQYNYQQYPQQYYPQQYQQQVIQQTTSGGSTWYQ